MELIGGGEMFNLISETISEKGLEQNVKLLGTMSPVEVRKRMEKASIFLFTSDQNEGWGVVLNEAMNSACAVVANQEIGAVPFLINHSENGFKMVYRRDTNAARKHKYGNWLTTTDGSEYWDATTTGIPNNVTSESQILLKPNYESLLDFCYYGNCTELIKNTINNIIRNFPAELTFTKKTIPFEDNSEIRQLGGDGYKYLVENPFNIDIITKKISNEEELNPLRYFALGYNRFILYLVSGKSDGCILSWDVLHNEEWIGACDNQWDYQIKINSDINIRRYYLRGKQYLLATITAGNKYDCIRPSEFDIDRYFNTLSDIEKALLDRYSIPKYTARLDYPHETERGIETYKKTFTWPLIGKWNLDIESAEYVQYLNGLLKLSEFYDEHNTDVMWKYMTHDSIKNMDITFTRSDDSTSEDYHDGATKMESLIWAYGRQFDEIKRYIDNIKYTNNITYNELNNLPNYFLTDTLNCSGWEVSSAVDGLDKEETVECSFSGESKEYTIEDTNTNFLRNLKINSKEILKRKGTRNSIEIILGLFGLRSKDFDDVSYDYKISEYVTIVSNSSGDVIYAYDEETGEENKLPIEKYNRLKDNIETDSPERAEADDLEGLPVRLVYFDVKEDDKLITKKYVIPWFDKVEILDGNPYFQMYGGWGKRLEKKMVNSEYPDIKKISEPSGTTIIYEESVKYLNIVPNISDLSKVNSDKIHNTDNIYYVIDITDIKTYFPDIDEDKTTNYFILKKENIDNYYIIGEREDEEKCGWENISTSDINTETEEGIKVLYLESLIDEYRGNNPHVGYGLYDKGSEFFKYFEQLFKGAIDQQYFKDEAYDCQTGDIKNEIKNIGFGNVEEIEDNKKCWYFINESPMTKMYSMIYVKGENRYIIKEMPQPTVDIECFDLSQQGKPQNNIFAADSVLNRKNLKIEFLQPKDNTGNFLYKEEYISYINQSVLPYLLQIIPSTTILEIEIEGENKN